MSNLSGHLSVHFQKAVVSEGVCVRVEGYKYIEKLERGAEGNQEEEGGGGQYCLLINLFILSPG